MDFQEQQQQQKKTFTKKLIENHSQEICLLLQIPEEM